MTKDEIRDEWINTCTLLHGFTTEDKRVAARAYDAGYEAAVAAERERVCEWRRSEPFLLTSECGYTAEVEELDNPFCPKCGGLVAEREKEGGEDATNK